MKLKPYLPALIVAILLTFTASSAFGVGLMGTTTGGTFRACVDPALITTPVNVGGGKHIAPGGLVRVPSGSACETTETSLNLNSYIKTVLVSPVSDNITNGNNLRNAVNNATAGTLVKLEPGTYDLGPTTLIMKQGVDLEGSGEGLTKITSQVGNAGFPPAGTLVLANNSEVRSLTIANTSNFKFNTGVYAEEVDKTARLSNVTITLSSTTDTNFGIYNNGSTPILKNSTISISGAANNFGIYSKGESSTTIQNSTISVTGVGNSFNHGIFSYIISSAIIQNSTISVTGGNTNYAIHSVAQSSATVQNSAISASGGSSSNSSIYNEGSTAKVVGSQLIGSIGGGGFNCVGAYDGNFTTLSANCNVLSHTTILVNLGANNQDNGANLRNALNAATAGTLVKLEPGTYDLGPTALTMKQGVDLEGSGEGLTKITSQVGAANFEAITGTVLLASSSEVRFLTIDNTSTSTYNAGVSANAVNKTARLTNVALVVKGNGSSNYGIFDDNGATPTIMGSTISVTGANDSNFGIYSNGGSSPIIQNSTISVAGVGNSINNGIFSYTFSTATLQNSTISASGGKADYGIHSVTQSSATVQNSTISASGGSSSNNSIYNEGSSAKVGSSQLVGLVGGIGSICASSYNANFTSLNAACNFVDRG